MFAFAWPNIDMKLNAVCILGVGRTRSPIAVFFATIHFVLGNGGPALILGAALVETVCCVCVCVRFL